MRRSTPWAAGCCGPKFIVKSRTEASVIAIKPSEESSFKAGSRYGCGRSSDRPRPDRSDRSKIAGRRYDVRNGRRFLIGAAPIVAAPSHHLLLQFVHCAPERPENFAVPRI